MSVGTRPFAQRGCAIDTPEPQGPNYDPSDFALRSDSSYR